MLLFSVVGLSSPIKVPVLTLLPSLFIKALLIIASEEDGLQFSGKKKKRNSAFICTVLLILS
jgi:hypothetical protein